MRSSWISPRAFLTDRCSLYAVVEQPNGDRLTQCVASNVPCRLIRQSTNRISNPSVQAGREELRGFYRLVVKNGTGGFDFVKLNGITYAVVSKSTERWTDQIAAVYNVEETPFAIEE